MTGELKNHHLRKTWDFQKILKKQQKVYNRDFTIFYGKSSAQENLCRFGISVPQRIVKKVVLRNKYKRQIRHALLELQRKRGGWNSFRGWDFLVIIREKFTTENFATKRDSLESLFNFFSQKVSNKSPIANKTFPRERERLHHYFEKTKNEGQRSRIQGSRKINK